MNLDPPEVTIDPDNITLTEEEEFEIFCQFTANPSNGSEIIW